MSITYKISYAFNDGATTITDKIMQPTGDTDARFDGVAAASATTEIDIAFPATLKAHDIVSDQAVTLKTNSDSVPDQTITLAANIAKVFGDDGAGQIVGTNVFSADVTKIFVHNAGSTNANIKIRALFDGTP